jgi:hypothetical protein
LTGDSPPYAAAATRLKNSPELNRFFMVTAILQTMSIAILCTTLL